MHFKAKQLLRKEKSCFAFVFARLNVFGIISMIVFFFFFAELGIASDSEISQTAHYLVRSS